MLVASTLLTVHIVNCSPLKFIVYLCNFSRKISLVRRMKHIDLTDYHIYPHTTSSSTYMFSDTDNTMDIAPKVMDRTYCENIAQHMLHVKDLPVECQTKYSDIVHELKRRDTDTTHPTQFLS